MAREKNMTAGNPAGLILTFAVPLIIGNLGQQFYAIVDSIIVGRGVGVKGLAAVGATDWTYWLFLWAIMALTQGFAIPVAQQYGKGDTDGLRKTLAMSIVLTGILSVALTVLGLLAIHPVLRLLQTPADIFDGAVSYLLFLFGGISVVMAYNMASAILRAFGDGRTPLIAMAIAAFTNIALDLLFVMVFRWGITGAAGATVLAQFIAFGYCAVFLIRSGRLRFTREDWRLDRGAMKWLCESGFTLAATQVLIAVGGMVLQSALNAQGSVLVAAFTASNKLLGLLESSAISLGYSITTYMAQNYGAGLYSRLRKGLKISLQASIGLSLVLGVLMVAAGRAFLSLFIDFTDPNAAQMLDIGYRYLSIMSALLFVLYILHVFRHTLQGISCGGASVVSGLMEFIARVLVALCFSRLWGETALYFAEPFAWAMATVSLVTMCLRSMSRLPDTDEERTP